MSLVKFPPLNNWEPTKKTLHLYSQAVGVIPRTHAEFHPKWWHVSLKVQGDGLITDEMPLPNGDSFRLFVDLREHLLRLTTSKGEGTTVSMTEGLSGTQFGERLIAAVADMGLRGEYARERFESDERREYDPEVAESYLRALVSADVVFKRHIATLQDAEGEVGQVQLWPHGFDLAVEWFGTRQVKYEEDGKVNSYPAQLNLGFSPGESSHPAPYFYSNPWPFEADELLDKPLPEGVRWFTESWQGTILPYAELAGDADAGERLFTYAQTVFKIASPTLLA